MALLEHNNRLDFGKSLMPDEGWKTSWAIGTTYSLDLEVLLGIPMALFHSKYMSEVTDLSNLRADMLDALNKVRERMFVFVHKNNISAKCRYSELMSFIDQNIFNVPVNGAFKSFHPKVWLVRYEKDEQPQDFRYRLIVMSRNITTATDFDIVVTMDSCKGNAKGHNKPLIDMMCWLMGKAGDAGKNIVRQFKKELREICFVSPAPFNKKEPVFWPHNCKDEPRESDFFFWGDKSGATEKSIDELLVISPFVDDEMLNFLSGKIKDDGKPVLVSREFEMDKCCPNTLSQWDCWQWNSMLEEAACYEEDEQNAPANKSYGISLHAKIYIANAKLLSDHKNFNNWFVGSVNCTQAGMCRNCEAMLHLRSDEQATSAGAVLESLKNDRLITPYAIKQQQQPTHDIGKQQRMRKLQYDISEIVSRAEVEQQGSDYDIKVFLDSVKLGEIFNNYSGVEIHLSSFASTAYCQCVKPGTTEYCFGPFRCSGLSPFLCVNVKYAGEVKEFLMKLPLSIPEERHAAVMSEILHNEERLMQYILFCLDPAIDGDMLEFKEGRVQQAGNGNGGFAAYSLPLYERLLLAASRNRSALVEIKRNIDKLKDSNCKPLTDDDGVPLLSDEFLELWNLFEKYIK